MPALTIVTGSPGTGKTTVARLLASAAPRGLHIPSDVFYTFPAHPVPPHLPESQAQNTAIIAAMTRMAMTFVAHGYDVFLDGIIGPWFLPVVTAELAGASVPAHYAVLSAPLDVALARVRARRDDSPEPVVAQMHAAFADLGAYARHRIETADRTPADVAAEIIRRIAAGDAALGATTS